MILPWKLREHLPFFIEWFQEFLITPLAEQFPTLRFASKADEWLASLKDKSIEQQFAERRIVEVKITWLFAIQGDVCLTEFKDGVIVRIHSECREKFQTLGHEIGHTFHLDLENKVIKNILPNRWEYDFKDPEQHKLYYLVENFADMFGEKWLALNGEDKMKEWRRRYNR